MCDYCISLNEIIFSHLYTDTLESIREHLLCASIVVGNGDATMNLASKISVIQKLSFWKQEDKLKISLKIITACWMVICVWGGIIQGKDQVTWRDNSNI